MKRWGMLVVVIGLLALALGCPRGPEKPAQPGVDTGQGQAAPQVPEGQPPTGPSEQEPGAGSPDTPSPTEDFPTIPEPTTGQPAIPQPSAG